MSYFNINIFILDLDNKNIYPYYKDDKYNKFKINILISVYKEKYEPIINIDNTKFIDNNSSVLENIISYNNLKSQETGFNKKNIIKIFEMDINIKILLIIIIMKILIVLIR